MTLLTRATKFLIPVVCLAGCQTFGEPTFCETFAAAGLVVSVRDAATNAPIASGALFITWTTRGDVVDSVAFPPDKPHLDSLAFAGAWERPGTYHIGVRKAGYRDWVRSSVEVSSEGCHVRPVRLTAFLQRS